MNQAFTQSKAGTEKTPEKTASARKADEGDPPSFDPLLTRILSGKAIVSIFFSHLSLGLTDRSPCSS